MKTGRLAKNHAAFQAEIVAVARRLFVEKGFGATSMDDVAAALRVSKPTVYEEFASKQSLFEAAVESAMLDYDLSWVEAAVRGEISFAAFMGRMAAEIMSMLSSPKRFELLRLVIREGSLMRSMSPALFERVLERITARWYALIASAMKHSECRRMEPIVVRRMLNAPLVFVVAHHNALGQVRDIEMTRAFLEESYRILGASLLLRPNA